MLVVMVAIGRSVGGGVVCLPADGHAGGGGGVGEGGKRRRRNSCSQRSLRRVIGHWLVG